MATELSWRAGLLLSTVPLVLLLGTTGALAQTNYPPPDQPGEVLPTEAPAVTQPRGEAKADSEPAPVEQPAAEQPAGEVKGADEVLPRPAEEVAGQQLPRTGVDVAWAALLAVLALGVGFGLLRVTSARRPGSHDELSGSRP